MNNPEKCWLELALPSDMVTRSLVRSRHDRYGVPGIPTAHMITRIAYQVLKGQVEYEAMRAEDYEQRYREREIKCSQRKAAKLGLSPSAPPPIVQAVL